MSRQRLIVRMLGTGCGSSAPRGLLRGITALVVVLTWLSGGISGQVQAAGFTVYSQGTGAMGQGNAFVAEADDPSAVFYNPAGINQLPRPTVYAMGLITMPSRDYEGLSGQTARTESAVLLSGTCYLVYPLTPKVALGFGVFAPFGQESTWPETWEGRYLTTHGSLKTYCFNPVVSWQIHENFAVALGFDALLSTVKLRRKVALPFGLPDSDSELKGEGTGYGFNLGFLWRVAEGVNLGLSYRYQLDVKYTGTLRLPQPTFVGIQMASFPASANLTFPHLLTLGVSVSRLDPWVFNFDVTWTGWSSFRAIEVRSSQPLLFGGVPTKLLVQPRDWHDAWTFRFGVNYRLHPLVKLRAGYTYDLSAIPDSTFDPQIINTDQHIFTLGADVNIRRLTLGLAYNYLLGEKRQKNTTIATNGVPAPLQANGSYQSTAHGWGISLAYQF